MAKYAHIRDGFLIDVWRVPEDYPDLTTRDRCLGADGWIEVPDDIVHGAKVNEDGTFTNPPPPPDPNAEPALPEEPLPDETA